MSINCPRPFSRPRVIAWSLAVPVLLSLAACGEGESAPPGPAGITRQQAYIKASNTEAADEFGRSLALNADGNTLAVGAPFEDSAATGIGGDQSDNTAPDAGAVYVYNRSGAAWSQQAYVKASNANAGDNFGTAVALSADGNTLAVGASGEASAATGIGGDQTSNTAPNAGAVYVYTRSGVLWTQQAYIKASNANANDLFGAAIALSGDGNTLVVGATGEASAATGIGGNQADNNAANAGAVYVYTRSGAVWTQQSYIKASNTGVSDQFGTSVAASSDGNTLAVGAPGEDSSAAGIGGNQADNSAVSSGAVYVFTRSGAVWAQQAYVKASNAGSADQFGTAVTLSGDGNTLSVGAPGEDSAVPGIGGSPADNSSASSGAVYVYTRSGVLWTQQAFVKSSNTGVTDQFGAALALSSDGNTLVVGAAFEDSEATGVGGNQAGSMSPNAGASYLYNRIGAAWTQLDYLKASNTGTDDQFGFALGLSGDGKRLAVGARNEDSGDIGIGGNQADNSAASAGAVYVFE